MSDLLDHRIKASGFRHSEHYIDCTCGASLTVPSMAGGSEVKAAAMLDEFWLSHKSPLIVKAPETAELERKVVEAAKVFCSSPSTEYFRSDDFALAELLAACQRLEQALTPPSLEDELTKLIQSEEACTSFDTKFPVDDDFAARTFAQEILALVKAHES